MQKSVPVVDSNQIPLMPTTKARADRWIKSGKATPFWKKGIFCVRLKLKMNWQIWISGKLKREL